MGKSFILDLEQEPNTRTLGCHCLHKHEDISNQHIPAVGHTHKESFEPKKSKIHPCKYYLGQKLVPGGPEQLPVPGESLLGPKLKIHVKTIYCEHFVFYQKIFLLPIFQTLFSENCPFF